MAILILILILMLMLNTEYNGSQDCSQMLACNSRAYSRVSSVIVVVRIDVSTVHRLGDQMTCIYSYLVVS